jgi:hypothetical protein
VVCYRALLQLYPHDLRTVYGAEMADVFEQQLQAEWCARGPRGVLATGWCAAKELLTVALPGRVLSERMIAPCLSLMVTTVFFLCLTAMLQDRALAQWIDHKFLFGGQ